MNWLLDKILYIALFLLLIGFASWFLDLPFKTVLLSVIGIWFVGKCFTLCGDVWVINK